MALKKNEAGRDISAGSGINRMIRESVPKEMALRLKPSWSEVAHQTQVSKSSKQQVYKRCSRAVHLPPTRTQGQVCDEKAS